MVSKRRFRSFEGASAVEFALLLPVLMLILFGIIFGGFAFNTKLTITQAAREGARFAATLPTEDGTTPPAADADWFDDVVERIEESAFGDAGLNTGERYICVRFVADDGIEQIEEVGTGDCTVDSTTVSDRERIEVVVSRPTTLQFIFASFDVELRSIGVSRYEAPVETGGT